MGSQHHRVVGFSNSSRAKYERTLAFPENQNSGKTQPITVIEDLKTTSYLIISQANHNKFHHSKITHQLQ
jgi:hypothetical protein